MTLDIGKKRIFLFLLAYVVVIIVLFFVFELMRGYESQTERMILSRVDGSRLYGNNLGNGLLLFIQNENSFLDYSQVIPNWIRRIGFIANHQLLESYVFNKNSVEVYTSQFGLMGDLAVRIFNYFGLTIWQLYITLKLFALFAQSIIITLFIVMIKIIFGKKSAVFVAILYLTPWLLIFSTNFFYIIQINLLFLVLPFFIGRRIRNSRYAQALIVFAYFVIAFIYSLMGYMFITIWISNIFLAIYFENLYSIKKLSKSIILQRMSALIMGFLIALSLHLNRLHGFDYQEKGQSWKIYILQNKIGWVQSPILDSRYRESIFVGVLTNLKNYLDMPFLSPWVQNKLNSNIPIFSIGSLILVLILIMLWRMRRDRIYGKFIFTHGLEILMISIIGIVSWLTILRPQSADNIHLNTIIFFLPFMQLLLGISFIDNSIVANLRERKVPVKNLTIYSVIVCTLCLVSEFILLFAKYSGY